MDQNGPGIKNIETKYFTLTGGSVMIVVGLVVIFFVDFLAGLIGAGSVNEWVRYGLGGFLVIAGVVWYFRQPATPGKGG